MVGIYKITSPSNKVYIGQSYDIINRFKDYTKGRCPSQRIIHNSICKYGHKAHIFSVIHELPKDITQDILNTYEILYWELYKLCGIKMLNLREPGSKGRNSPETRKRISIANKGKPSKNKGVTGFFKHTEEWKQNAAKWRIGNKSRTGQKNTPEAIKKTADARRGVPRSEETKRKISEAQKGKIITEEQRRQISATLTGRKYGKRKPHSEETKLKIREALKGKSRIPWNKGKVGYKIHTEDSKKRISEAVTKRYKA